MFLTLPHSLQRIVRSLRKLRRPPNRRHSHRPNVLVLEGRWCPSGYNPTDLGTLGGTSSLANAINNATPAQVVGWADTASAEQHAFRWTQGGTNGVPTNKQMQDLGTLPGDTSSF